MRYSVLGGGKRVRALLAGEAPAFDAFFSEYFPRLYRFVLPRVDFISTVSGGGYIGSFLGRFFDRVLYYAAVGYEQERNRIGGKQKRRKGDK